MSIFSPSEVVEKIDMPVAALVVDPDANRHGTPRLDRLVTFGVKGCQFPQPQGLCCMAGKQAKVIGDDELAAVLAACDATRYPLRNRAVVLLSFKAGLRAMEIAKVRRHMVLDARGKLDTCLRLEDKICKKGSGRIVPMPAGELLHRTLADLLAAVPGPPRDPLILSERAEEDKWTKQMMDDPRPMDPKSIIRLFQRLYRKVGLIGCSSHSGRRTYITRMARALVQIPGSSLRDVQYIAGHANLTTTQRYIEHNPDVLDRLARLV